MLIIQISFTLRIKYSNKTDNYSSILMTSPKSTLF